VALICLQRIRSATILILTQDKAGARFQEEVLKLEILKIGDGGPLEVFRVRKKRYLLAKITARGPIGSGCSAPMLR
jgi:hypothetical protein